MQNIIETIVMLIDMYYHRKKLMKRWRSIKRYQRTGIIGYKPSGLPISKNPPIPKKLVNTELDYYSMNRAQAQSKQNRRLSDDILLYLNNIGADIQYINDIRYDTFKFRIKYKNHITELEFTNNQTDVHINQIIRNNILNIERQVYLENLILEKEKEKEKLAIKNNPHNLEVGKQYLMKYKHYYESHFTLVTITRFTDLGFPWAQCSTGYRCDGIISPNMYDIKTIDGKWIHNCKQWDEFQAKKKLNNDYQLDESDLKYLRDRGVQFSFGLSNVKGQHSVLKIVYKYKTETHIFYTRPLKADIFNTIMDFVKLVDRKEAMLGVMGTSAPW